MATKIASFSPFRHTVVLVTFAIFKGSVLNMCRGSCTFASFKNMPMILFFRTPENHILAVQSKVPLEPVHLSALEWLFDGATLCPEPAIEASFIGPRREMITPFSTTAVEITQNMNIPGIERIELFLPAAPQYNASFDKMLQARFGALTQSLFTIDRKPEPILQIDDIAAYSVSEGLALSPDEIAYLNGLSDKLGRKLTDSEIFGFSQVNSEHCRHKIFNGTFVIDGQEMPKTLFRLIRDTSAAHPNRIVSAYKDNCAFIEGPKAQLFKPAQGHEPSLYEQKEVETVIALKAETHNFPTTVEPFNGAATGSGGEIRDRVAGGMGSFPLAGTAVYMTSYPRFEGEDRPWEKSPARPWLYQSPQDILIKASNGASDFGNKFGQPLICGSLLTLEHTENRKQFGYDKVIMMAGGVGFARKDYSLKAKPQKGDKVVLMGGDNYRIGMGGGAVSSVATGEFANAIELNAVQRSNPEMQKRICNAIRALAESDENPIVSIHDHGAGGHLNCLSELVEETGGIIEMDKLPIGDPTLSAKEIIGNESQERMGMIIGSKDIEKAKAIAERERAPIYVIGETTGDHRFLCTNTVTDEKPIDLAMADFFGSTPKTIMTDRSVGEVYPEVEYETGKLTEYVEQVLKIEAVACKDWLTNKVDRSVTGRIMMQQTAGEIQLPLNNMGITAIDYAGFRAIATSIGHAPAAAILDAAAGSRLAIAEALANLVWAPIEGGIKGVSLSANWMWPCRNEGEDARLYSAVEAASNFCIALGINIPTGKDSMSMTQKYPDGQKVLAPGSLLVSSVAEITDFRKAVTPVIKKGADSVLFYVDLTGTALTLGGSSFAQTRSMLGATAPDIASPQAFVNAFTAVQSLIDESLVLAGHDVSSGGLITTLLELCFANREGGLEADLSILGESDPVKLLLSENPAWVLQVDSRNQVRAMEIFAEFGVDALLIGKPIEKRVARIFLNGEKYKFDIDALRDTWFRSSFLLDNLQTANGLAEERFVNYKSQPLSFRFPKEHAGSFASYAITPRRTGNSGITAAIIREKGINGEREMAWALWLAGFDVKDVHMTDLVSGRETLDDVNLIVFTGGFSNADVLGSAKGWAGAFLYNEKAGETLKRFYARKDTLSLGICNGCQVMVHLGLITPDADEKPRMEHNRSMKFESGFVNVDIEKSNSVFLGSMEGSRLGIWIAHGEGRFNLPGNLSRYNVALRYSHQAYPGNPNGSPEGIAGIASADGRHLVMMPHPERAISPFTWAHYPETHATDEVSPWIGMFVNARKWVESAASTK